MIGNICSSLYALKLGQGVGVMGLEHGGIQIEEIGELESKDATRHRIRVRCYVSTELGFAIRPSQCQKLQIVGTTTSSCEWNQRSLGRRTAHL